MDKYDKLQSDADPHASTHTHTHYIYENLYDYNMQFTHLFSILFYYSLV